MNESSRLDNSMTGVVKTGERSRLRRAGSSAAVAGVLIAAWTALSCGGKTDRPTQRTEQGSSAGGDASSSNVGGSDTANVGGAATRASSASANTTGGRSQPRTGAVSSNPTGGASSALSAGGGASASGVGAGGAAATANSAAALGGSSGVPTLTPETAGGRSSGTVLASAGQTGTVIDPSALPARLSGLATNAAWKQLQDLWREMDAVAPTASTYAPYANTIDAEQRDQWVKDLATLLSTIDGLGILSANEILFLRQVATARVEVMLDGGYHYETMLHRSPMPFEGQAEDSIRKLEQKIDSLLKLKDRCVIDAATYRLALEQVEREAVTLFVFAQLTEELPTRQLSVAIPTDLEGAALASELDRRLEALQAEAGMDQATLEKIDAMRKRLSAIQGTVTSLQQLVRMLEPCD